MQYSVHFNTQTCGKSSDCVPVASCSDIMKPKTFLDKLCGREKVCCEKDPGILFKNSDKLRMKLSILGCVEEFPEIEHKKDGM